MSGAWFDVYRVSENDFDSISEIALNENRSISAVVRDGVRLMISDSMRIVVLKCQLADELKKLENQITQDETKNQVRKMGKKLWS